MSKKPPVAKKEEAPKALQRQPHQKQQRHPRRKLRKENGRRNTERKREFTQCTRLKETRFPEHAQPVNGVDQDTSWRTTMKGTLAVTAGSQGTSRNKQF